MKVSLRRLSNKDVFHLRSIIDEDTAEKCYLEWPFTKEVAFSFISNYNTWGIWINNGILAGAIEIKKDMETAYFVSKKYRNLGIATNAVIQCKERFSDQQLHCVINPDNKASLKVANKANLRVSFFS
jgi:RimJ/RimL family protein N-acetyltransferase